MEPHCETEQIRALVIVSDRDFCKKIKAILVKLLLNLSKALLWKTLIALQRCFLFYYDLFQWFTRLSQIIDTI